jgi:hypothetical protein
MPKSHRSHGRHPFDDAIRAARREKAVPHEFVLQELAPLSPVTRPMFGCLAVYVEDKIMLVLRDRPTSPADNGVWLATALAHHESLRRDFPRMRSIRVLGREPTQWQVLAADDADFEAAAMLACRLILAGDSRIGKVPKRAPRSARLPSRRARTGAKRAEPKRAQAKHARRIR